MIVEVHAYLNRNNTGWLKSSPRQKHIFFISWIYFLPQSIPSSCHAEEQVPSPDHWHHNTQYTGTAILHNSRLTESKGSMNLGIYTTISDSKEHQPVQSSASLWGCSTERTHMLSFFRKVIQKGSNSDWGLLWWNRLVQLISPIAFYQRNSEASEKQHVLIVARTWLQDLLLEIGNTTSLYLWFAKELCQGTGPCSLGSNHTHAKQNASLLNWHEWIKKLDLEKFDLSTPTNHIHKQVWLIQPVFTKDCFTGGEKG